MKRWWVWVLGIVGVLVLSFVALAVLLPHGAPYEFLKGERPVRINMGPAERKQLSQMGMDYEVYSFKSDFVTLNNRAREELLKEGYMDQGAMMGAMAGSKAAQPIPDMGMYMKADMAALMSAGAAMSSGTASGPPKMPEMQMVMIIKDTRTTSSTNMMAPSPPNQGKDKGWVTVMVVGTGEKTIFQRFRDWIGL